jgi:hypothetical protein
MPVKKAVKPIKVEMKFDRSTKGTHVFTAEDDNAPIPTLYVRKSGFENGAPEGVTVTVELAE